MCARTDRCRADAHGRRDRAEGLVDAAALQWGAGAGQEERRGRRSRAEPVTTGGVTSELLGDGRVPGHQPRAIELRVPDRDHPGAQLDVVAFEADGFAEAHAGGGEQPEQKAVALAGSTGRDGD